jgi:hypothetical protein
MINYNLITNRPPIMQRWSISKMQSMRSRSCSPYIQGLRGSP